MSGTSYTRQSTFADGDTITASLFNTEYNQLVASFAYASSGTTGHQHDGGAGEGGNIHTIGDQDFLNKIVVDSTNNRWSVFVEVGGSAVEQVRIEDGVVYPVTDSDVDLGTNALRFKNAYIDSLTATGNLTVGGNITVTGNVDVDGIVEFDGLSGTGSVTVTDILDQDDMSGDSATALATQQSIKAYVDAQQDTVDTFGEVLALSNTTAGTDISVSTDDKVQFRDAAIYINSSADGQLDIVADTEIQIAATTIDINGAVALNGAVTGATNITLSGELDAATGDFSGAVDIDGALDVAGTTNLDVVDIDGAVDMATTLAVAGNVDFNGDLDVDGTTNLDVVDIDGAVDMASTLTVASNIVVGGTVDGRDVATDGTKLDGIEASATADQSNAEIRTAVEAATDSNVFTDADHSKLNAIEASATADQTDAEIRAAVEAATDSNVFTDADHTKLNAIEASADVTDTANVTAAGALMDSELTAIASVKALNQGVATGDSPTFAALTSTGEITANGGIALGDSDKATFGASDDLQIYHDGSSSYITDAGTGNLYIDSSDTVIRANGAENSAKFIGNGRVELYYDAVKKFETTATGISVTGEVAATSLDISGDIDVDGTTNLDVVDIDGAVDMASTLAVGGVVTANAGVVVDNFTLDGTTLALSSGDMVLHTTGNDFDIIFNGSDGGVAITALRLDMSSLGAATFNSTISSGAITATDANANPKLKAAYNSSNYIGISHEKINVQGGGVGLIIQGNGVDRATFSSGGGLTLANGNLTLTSGSVTTGNMSISGQEIDVSSGDLTLDVAGDIILDSGGFDVKLKVDGTEYAKFSNYQNNFYLEPIAQDKDLIIRGNDGGSVITALTLDMSNGGSATFNKDILMGDGNPIRLGDSQDLRIFYSGGSIFQDVTSDSDMLFKGNDGGSTITALTLDMSAAGAATFNAGVTSTSLTVDGSLGQIALQSSGAELHFSRNGNNDLLANGGSSAALTIGANDNVRFLTGGSENFRISADGSLSTPTAGTSNVRFGVNAGNSIASGGNYNVVVGDEAGTALTLGDESVAVGFEALMTASTGSENVGIGYRALKLTTGNSNVAVGKNALATNSSASNNTAVGTSALTANTTGSYNTAVGLSAGRAVTTGLQNTLIGGEAGDSLTDADYNVAMGVSSLGSDTLGSRATALGFGTLANQNFTSATDNYNVAVGFQTGGSVTSGFDNTLIGGLAGDALTDADYNTAIGKEALTSDTLGSRSTAVGWSALANQNFTSATNSYNTAMGFQAGLAITTGTNNTLIGGLAGDALTDADHNVAVGGQALSTDTLGSRSVAIGQHALQTQNFTSATNAYNVAVGYDAGVSVTTGTSNTLIGGEAGDSITTAQQNTFIGRHSGNTTTTGNDNVCVGRETKTSAVNSANQIVIGDNVTGNANSSFCFGKDATDSAIAFGATSITAPSDQRYKEEIVDAVAGLSFVNDLRPVTFKWKKEKDIPSTQRAYVEGSETRVMNDYTNHGFIAQEVKTVIDAHSEIKDGFDMWMEDEADGRQRLGPSALIPVLVKAIQELTARIETLEG